MHLIIALYAIAFAICKYLGEFSVENALGTMGALPTALSENTYASKILATAFHFEPVSLGLSLLTIGLARRLLASHSMGFEWAALWLGSAVMHGAVGKGFELATTGMTALVCACLAFEIVYRVRVESLRLARNTFLAGAAALVISPHTSWSGVLAGTCVGVVIALCAQRERSLCHLSVASGPMKTALPPASRPQTAEEILTAATNRWSA